MTKDLENHEQRTLQTETSNEYTGTRTDTKGRLNLYWLFQDLLGTGPFCLWRLVFLTEQQVQVFCYHIGPTHRSGIASVAVVSESNPILHVAKLRAHHS